MGALGLRSSYAKLASYLRKPLVNYVNLTGQLAGYTVGSPQIGTEQIRRYAAEGDS